MEQPRRLAQTGHFLSFLYPSGPWIDTKDFRPVPDGPITAIEALQALLADPEYRDHYCSPENISSGGPLHGLYWADRIKASDFGEVSVADCESILSGWRTDWVSEDDPPEEKIEADAVIGTALWLIRRAAHRLYLRDVRDEAEHEWGWVIGQGGFHEFVLVDRDGGISLVVASDD